MWRAEYRYQYIVDGIAFAVFYLAIMYGLRSGVGNRLTENLVCYCYSVRTRYSDDADGTTCGGGEGADCFVGEIVHQFLYSIQDATDQSVYVILICCFCFLGASVGDNHTTGHGFMTEQTCQSCQCTALHFEVGDAPYHIIAGDTVDEFGIGVNHVWRT